MRTKEPTAVGQVLSSSWSEFTLEKRVAFLLKPTHCLLPVLHMLFQKLRIAKSILNPGYARWLCNLMWVRLGESFGLGLVDRGTYHGHSLAYDLHKK